MDERTSLSPKDAILPLFESLGPLSNQVVELLSTLKRSI